MDEEVTLVKYFQHYAAFRNWERGWLEFAHYCQLEKIHPDVIISLHNEFLLTGWAFYGDDIEIKKIFLN